VEIAAKTENGVDVTLEFPSKTENGPYVTLEIRPLFVGIFPSL
jgi:hypothetical protein